IGRDGLFLKERLEGGGVDTSCLSIGAGATGHAMIQVNSKGENSIVLFGGENLNILPSEIESTLGKLKEKCSHLLLQNEINGTSDIMKLAGSMGFRIIFNAAPMNGQIKEYPLELVNLFLLNEIEGAGLTGRDTPDEILDSMKKLHPYASTLLTLGSEGAVYQDSEEKISVPAERVEPIDTTAAGDTFIGFFLAHLLDKKADKHLALRIASKAAAACIRKKGAVDSIPFLEELR
ncbi:MAG: ribokinase, partial [Oligoflexales bacterium]|nr:ribokinase [Oligoflexales bacterium]